MHMQIETIGRGNNTTIQLYELSDDTDKEKYHENNPKLIS